MNALLSYKNTPVSEVDQSWVILKILVFLSYYETPISTVSGPTSTAFTNAGITPLMIEFLRTLQQVPFLIDVVSVGAHDFDPSPKQVKSAARLSYCARRMLL